MYMPPISMMINMTLILSVFMAISSSNWFFIWMSMELNMLSFIPLMLNNKHIMEMEGAVKYFMVQSMASSCMLMCSMSMWFFMFSNVLFKYLMLMALLMKLGSFPCHFWFPNVMTTCKWNTCILLTTWQKLIPLFVVFSILDINKKLLMVICLSNMVIGGMFGMNNTNIKSIMGYSSISHMGWMLSLKMTSMVLGLYIYFFMYIIMTIPLFFSFNKTMILNTNSLKLMNKHSFTSTFIICMLIMSMAGLPPFTGFFMKMMVLYYVLDFSLFFSTSMVILSIMSLYFYLNLCYNMLLNTYMTNNKMYMKKKINVINKIFFMMSSLVLTPMIFML
uniref:NADH dehydrogenase subunit 2 n=1 Tax=Calliobdella nodulifera TaxID=3385569 RepID=UPI0020798BD6|nr:NADH dehydrogenase subunit 2 [Notostomum cyclostomum]URP31064.1 NADH dehydrogenase subunit 2 [Notostomum cyclostomum]